MKPLVNLSNEPFTNRRLFWLAVLLLFVVPSYFGIQAISNLTTRELEISNRTDTVRALETQLNKKTENPIRVNTTITPDRNRELLVAADLITRRSFSWSQLLTDIERNLPSGVRIVRINVTRIQPQEKDGTIGDDINATFDLEVIGKSGQEITNMINRFQESRRFKVVPVTQTKQEGVADVEFKLRVDYFPPSSTAQSSPSNRVASGQTESGQIAERKQ
jgi:hypothetical protein